MYPELRDEREEEQGTAKVEFFKSYMLTDFCTDTVGRWLKKLAFLCVISFQVTITSTGMRIWILFGTCISS